MKKCILHGFHEELRSLGDSWRIAFFTDFLNNAPLVGFVDNWFGELHEEQHVSRSFMKNCVFRGFHDFCVGFMQNCFLQGSISSRIAFLTGLMIYCILHGFHEELDFPCVSWLIAVPLSCVGSFFLHRLDEQSHCSRIPWRISRFRGRRAELHIPLVTQKLGFAIEPWRIASCMDLMKNCILPGFLKKCFSERLRGKDSSSWISWKIAFSIIWGRISLSAGFTKSFFPERFHEELDSSWVSWRIALFRGFVRNRIFHGFHEKFTLCVFRE